MALERRVRGGAGRGAARRASRRARCSARREEVPPPAPAGRRKLRNLCFVHSNSRAVVFKAFGRAALFLIPAQRSARKRARVIHLSPDPNSSRPGRQVPGTTTRQRWVRPRPEQRFALPMPSPSSVDSRYAAATEPPPAPPGSPHERRRRNSSRSPRTQARRPSGAAAHFSTLPRAGPKLPSAAAHKRVGT